MIRIDILIKSPIYLVGLTQVLNEAGIKVIASRTSPQEEPSWLADATLIGIDALTPPDHLADIARTASNAAVLVLTDDADANRNAYLDAGAGGAISKSASGDHLAEAIRAVISAPPRLSAARTRRCTSSASRGDQIGGVGGHGAPASSSLFEREEQVLRQISRGLTQGQIATRLGISPHTVDTYVKRIRAKLGVGNKAELTRVALLGRFPTPYRGRQAIGYEAEDGIAG